MKVKELFGKTRNRIIAFDAMDGKLLFDSERNKKIFMAKFLNGDICAIWADIKPASDIGYNRLYKPVIMIYVTHGSWEVQDDE